MQVASSRSGVLLKLLERVEWFNEAQFQDMDEKLREMEEKKREEEKDANQGATINEEAKQPKLKTMMMESFSGSTEEEAMWSSDDDSDAKEVGESPLTLRYREREELSFFRSNPLWKYRHF
jgi:hypothetical protein